MDHGSASEQQGPGMCVGLPHQACCSFPLCREGRNEVRRDGEAKQVKVKERSREAVDTGDYLSSISLCENNNGCFTDIISVLLKQLF